MEPKDRRNILGRVASLMAAPLLLGKDATVRSLLSDKYDPPSRPEDPLPRITTPSHSVMRRG